MRILLVEDEPDLALALRMVLLQARYAVDWAIDLRTARTYLAEAPPDLLILDVMLPEGEDAGFTLAQELRQMGFGRPILFLTARDALDDRVQGLELGADDYLVKPFEMRELLARVRALLRREGQVKQARLQRGPLEVDFTRRRVFWNGHEVFLAEREFALLELMALNPEKTFTLEELLERVFPDASSGYHAVRMCVSRLRNKLSPEAIETVPGGYRLGLS
ncbi:response regulator transcription factor [Meiothermus rufus]|uniref:response regulator transcription factor n=1 Tax=Meiothermus rufus TaxID=604332 RepID=UPI000418D788|nr:response regulator transcription factor [Meiothermus rufus]